MTLPELFTLFLRHRHSGTYPDASRLKKIEVEFNDYYTLISPSGVQYKLGITNNGVLTITDVFCDTLRSSSGLYFKVGVSNEGAITVTDVTSPDNWVSHIDIYSPDGTKFLLEVTDEGIITITPA